jgi:hypothetical protein
VDYYMEAVRIKAQELAAMGRPVAEVYLTSQNNLHVFHNESYLQHTYGGNYTYRLLPMTDVGLDGFKDMEGQLHRNHSVNRLPIVTEFLTDLEILVSVMRLCVYIR